MSCCRVCTCFSHLGPLRRGREGRHSFASTQPLTHFSVFCLLSSCPPCITFLLHFPPFFISSHLPSLLPPTPLTFYLTSKHTPPSISVSPLDKKTLFPPLFFQGTAEFGPPLQPYMVKCRQLHQVPKRGGRRGSETARPIEENHRGGGDRRQFASHPTATSVPKASHKKHTSDLL